MKLTILSIFLLVSSLSFAKDKTAYFNFQKILEESKMGKKLTKESELEQRKKIKSLDELKSSLEKKYKTFLKQKNLLNGEAILRKEAELASQEQIINLKAKRLAKEQSLADKNRYIRLDKEIYVYVKRIAKDKDLVSVFEESQKPFYSKNISDITSEILRLMNK